MTSTPTPLTPPAKRFGGLGRSRPSLRSTRNSSLSSSPSRAPQISRDMLARKTSYNQLTQNSLASIPDAGAGYSLRHVGGGGGGGGAQSTQVEVGDLVNTPGGMHGIVKFIGNVKGKGGVFVGVELEGELAGKGKNDGAVDGIRYFTTAQPLSGIFVPLARASKRDSTDSSQPPPTPTLDVSSPTGASSLHPPSLTPNRNRSESPAPRSFGMKTPNGGRPSLTGGLLPPSAPRAGSAMGSRIGALSPTPGLARPNFGARSRAGSTANERPAIGQGRPQFQTLKQPKSSLTLRSGSSLGMSRSASSMGGHEEEPMSAGGAAPYNPELSPIDSGIGMAKNEQHLEELNALKAELADRDRQLKEQATALLEMEASLAELQNLVHTASSQQSMSAMSPQGYEDADAQQLRALLREKNEKIQQLTAEFDAHRADFRSTIDTLELASSETERVYEKRVADLLEDIRELQDRNEDVDSVARQLKQLEELVQELEEGLEDARRGEAEARGEVEFLRGEVERSREELRREKEKSAAAVANAAVGKMMRNGQDEVDKKDDEIRGLKAIIHSLSRDSVALDDATISGALNGDAKDGHSELVQERQNTERLNQEIVALQNQIKYKVNREEELEREIEELRKKREARTSNASEKAGSWGPRVSGDARGSWRARQGLSGTASGSPSLRKVSIDTMTSSVEAPVSSSENKDNVDLTPIDSDADADSTAPWCEICEASGHDILTCTNMFGSGAGGPASAGPNGSTTAAAAAAAAEQELKSERDPSPAPRQKETPSPMSELPSGGPPSVSPAPPTESDYSFSADTSTSTSVVDKKKSVHLPHLPPPPPVDMNSSFGPVGGKESGVVDMDKWCALCERDGHDSVDCPLDTDF